MPNENTLPTPETRREMFLAAAAGESVEKPEPITREEMFLNAIGGGSGDAYTKEETDELLDDKADLVDGKVPASQLPSYVDDVIEYTSVSAFPATGESGKIYVAQDTNKTYRWGGSAYVEISESLALGETASTAYPGNKGKANADAIGTLSSLTTTVKADLVSAINEINGTIGDINTVLEGVL